MLFHPWILEGLGILLLAVGAAGLGALFISRPMRSGIRRTVGAVCAVMALGGVLLMTRAEAMRDVDRDLSPAEQAVLAKAISRFPNIKFEVFTAHTDNETAALAAKVADAVKAATGVAPRRATIPPLKQKGVVPPLPQKGVVIVVHDREDDLGRAVSATIGRALMAARVACITDDEPALDDRTVRIVVGEKP
ncbi:hypothetical protein SAMN02990966_00163 [Rhodospirillales bacterium URHD0017]|nr:hypothetical protein SAMN02990966_00163 [Rhodospirillales bacterium URHD0017]